jgi:hypothetical protein
MALPAPAVGQVYLVTTNGLAFGQMVLNTFYYQVSIVGSETDIRTLASNMFAKLTGAGSLTNGIFGCTPPQYQMVELWIQNVFPIRYRKFVNPMTTPGAFPQNASTANLATTITRFGDQANKHNRGSLHLLAPNLDPGTTAGDISGALATAASTLALRLNASITTTGLTVLIPGLWPKKATAAQQFVPVTGSIVESTVRVMRRRTVGVGK